MGIYMWYYTFEKLCFLSLPSKCDPVFLEDINCFRLWGEELQGIFALKQETKEGKNTEIMRHAIKKNGTMANEIHVAYSNVKTSAIDNIFSVDILLKILFKYEKKKKV